MTDFQKNCVYGLIVSLITLGAIVLIVSVSLPLLENRYSTQIAAMLIAAMSSEEKTEYYENLVAAEGAMWDTVPEHRVGRIGMAGRILEHKQAEIRFNNAGLRSSSNYGKKDPGRFRIVCLGDSFVFGTGGREEDRFCNQLAEHYSRQAVTVDGREIETLAVGLGSWTAVQGATYLSSRISEYDPDLIVVLSTSNDITSSSGVTGKGVYTQKFSPQYREYGSALYSLEAPLALGYHVYNLIADDLSPISNQMWDDAMRAFQRLSDLQSTRGGLILFSVLEQNARFRDMFLRKYHESGISDPIVTTSYFPGPETRLPHDNHPNREGHSILANHYISVFHRLSWIQLQSPPVVDTRLGEDVNPEVVEEELRFAQRRVAEQYLSDELRFEKLDADSVRGILGGFFHGREAGRFTVWASIRAAFLLRADGNAEILELEIGVPDKTELIPLPLTVRVNGKLALDTRLSPGRHTLEIPLTGAVTSFGVHEVVIETPRYFTGITDHRMKSYRMYGAKLQ